MRTAVLAALLVLSACSEPAQRTADNSAAPPAAAVELEPAAAAADDLVGRWVAVEGLYLVVAPGLGPGRYRLEMQYDLDNRGVFDGVAAGDGIAFVRNGEQLALRRTDGAATGLKYLAGKADCLTVKPGEGYCRD